MALVTIEVPRDALSGRQKDEVSRRVTDALACVLGEPLREMTWVRICEIEEHDWAVGGRPLDACELHRIAAARAGEAA